MFDINFFKDSYKIKQKIVSRIGQITAEEVYTQFEKQRNTRPFVFNIETTNVCNMQCVMCPRPKLMNRSIQHMSMELFEKVVRQIKPHTKDDLMSFWEFVREKYGVSSELKDENTFYFHTVAKSLTLHGFGEPLLDPYMNERILLCSALNIPTYFSCVPANINVEKVWDMMKAGLGTIKFSIDSLDDSKQKEIRGENNNFTDSYRKISELAKLKAADPSVKTQMIATMIALSDAEKDRKTYVDFMKLWKDKPIFAYIKSQDNRWFHKEDEEPECRSHYEQQYCEFPWMSLTVMVDGSVAPCSQDYNCEISMGNANTESLEDIWNNAKFDQLRKWHIAGGFPGDYKCSERCDLKLLCDRLSSVSDLNRV